MKELKVAQRRTPRLPDLGDVQFDAMAARNADWNIREIRFATAYLFLDIDLG